MCRSDGCGLSVRFRSCVGFSQNSVCELSEMLAFSQAR